MLFDPPSLALGELPLLTAAQRDGQIVPLALSGVCVHVFESVQVCACPSERTVKTLPLSNAAQVEVLLRGGQEFKHKHAKV